eukprot:4432654-Prymnesium_polylepis.1
MLIGEMICAASSARRFSIPADADEQASSGGTVNAEPIVRRSRRPKRPMVASGIDPPAALLAPYMRVNATSLAMHALVLTIVVPKSLLAPWNAGDASLRAQSESIRLAAM